MKVVRERGGKIVEVYKHKELPRPKLDQPVFVRLQYTGWRVVERTIMFPSFADYLNRGVSRYRRGGSDYRKGFHVLEVYWNGKPGAKPTWAP